MGATPVLWIIIGIIVLLIIVGLVFFIRRRMLEHSRIEREHNQVRAADMRQDAQATELDARENEAKATRATADSQLAAVEADRLQQEAGEREAAARGLHRDSTEQRSRADSLDPDIDTRQGNNGDSSGTPDGLDRKERPNDGVGAHRRDPQEPDGETGDTQGAV